MRVHNFWRSAVCWDKDSTLADTSGRQWMVADVKAGKLTWDDYARACANDAPVEAARTLMQELAVLHAQVIMSGATECPEIHRWLKRHEFPYDDIYLPPPGNTVENGLLKAQWVKEMQAAGTRVVLFVEDWPETAEIIRNVTGVPVLVLNPCYPPELAAAKAHRAGNV